MKLPNFKIKNTLIAGATSLILLSVVGVAIAQEVQRSFTVINPQISEKLNPGGYAEGTTRVINNSTAPLTFNVEVRDYTVGDTQGTPQILPSGTLNNKYSAASWIEITPSVFTVQPGKQQLLNYYIQIPKDARPGGHYAAIVYTPAVNKENTGSSGGTVNAQIGSLFYLTVNGPVNEQATVIKFFANAFQEYGPVKILTEIQNLGDLHITPQGGITVSGLFVNKQYALPQQNIFPGGVVRDFQNSVGQTFMIGRYKAELLGSYGTNNNLPLTASVYFWVFPWRLAVIIVLIVIAVILGGMYINKRRKNQVKKPEEKKEAVDTEVKS